ncbi:MAG: sigma 54-interacting transcriptional regulator [Nitrospirota bacterium]|nr:sigma 54-interacting transcriptional regulator [Nitrospirota bacterium]
MTIRSMRPVAHDETLLARLFVSLETAVLERTDRIDTFSLRGTAPAWWVRIFGSITSTAAIRPGERSPFLKQFFAEAEQNWTQNADGISRSGPWTERDQQGQVLHLEATALVVDSRQLLLVARLGADFEQTRETLQRAREQALRHTEATKSHARAESRLTTRLSKSEGLRDDLLGVLQELGLATILTDGQGQITFVSDEAARLLGLSPDVRGAIWEQVPSCSRKDRDAIRTRLRRPPAERQDPLTLRLETDNPRWLDMTVSQHPLQGEKRILFFHDTTEVHDLRRLLDEKARFHDLVGSSPSMVQVYQLVRDVARVDATVLIEGETGTGKELIARAIHLSSARKHGPFIAANCAGLTDSLLGSQLFGHKRGAFTGAVSDQAGLFESADGGTVFLDEIGDIPLNVQTSLLRVLQEKEITRLGESKPRKMNVRVLAATHHHLSEDVVRGTFRADLLYRIRVARIQLPPLRDRRDDIPLLASAFLGQIRATMGKGVDQISPEALRLLLTYTWPGNVRELKSAIEFAAISCKGQRIGMTDLPPEISQSQPGAHAPTIVPFGGHDERTQLLRALDHVGGNRSEAAKLLGVSRATLYRRLADHHIDIPR